jgi:hypothetical protein
MRRC